MNPQIGERIGALEVQVTTHEAVCAERYARIDGNIEEVKSRYARVEGILWTITGAVVMQLVGVIGYLVTHMEPFK